MAENVLVVGSSVVDLTFYTPKIPGVGETVLGRFVQGLGGKGFNQSVACSRSGASTRFLSALGPVTTDAFTPLFEKKLRDLGIQFQFQYIEGAATGAAAISVDQKGNNNIIVSLGANEKLSPQFLESQIDFFKNLKVILFQFETCFEAIECSIKLAKKYSPGVTVILNPAPALKNIPSIILNQTDIFTPNETELQEVTQLYPDSLSGLAKACSLVTGPKAVIATLGDKGCYYYTKEFSKSYEAFNVEAKDTSGAGDAFNGGLACGLIRFNGDIDKSIRYACAVAGISVTRPGTSASMPDKAEVDDFLNNQSSHQSVADRSYENSPGKAL